MGETGVEGETLVVADLAVALAAARAGLAVTLAERGPAPGPGVGRGGLHRRAVIRLFNLLTRPDELLADGELMSRVAPIVADPHPDAPPPVEGPTRDEVLTARIMT